MFIFGWRKNLKSSRIFCSFVAMKISKFINYSRDMCQSCQGTVRSSRLLGVVLLDRPGSRPFKCLACMNVYFANSTCCYLLVFSFGKWRKEFKLHSERTFSKISIAISVTSSYRNFPSKAEREASTDRISQFQDPFTKKKSPFL
jgi:hypothetical protein